MSPITAQDHCGKAMTRAPPFQSVPFRYSPSCHTTASDDRCSSGIETTRKKHQKMNQPLHPFFFEQVITHQELLPGPMAGEIPEYAWAPVLSATAKVKVVP